MRTMVIALLTLFSAVQISAQGITLNNKCRTNQFYADLVSKAASLNGDWGLFGGLRAGYNITESVSLGLAAHGLIPEKLGDSYINRSDRSELHIGYGGAEVIYNYNLSDLFYLTGNLMIGAGRVDYEGRGNDYFFITEPGAALNLRITRWFGLGYSVNYRVASGVKYAEFSNASLSGWSTDLHFKFGF